MTEPVPDFLRRLESLPIPAGATEIERRLLQSCQAELATLYDAGDVLQAMAYEPIVECLIGRIQAAAKHDSRVVELLAANNFEVERRRTAETALAETKTGLADARAENSVLQNAINDAFVAHECGESGVCWQILSDHYWNWKALDAAKEPTR